MKIYFALLAAIALACNVGVALPLEPLPNAAGAQEEHQEGPCELHDESAEVSAWQLSLLQTHIDVVTDVQRKRSNTKDVVTDVHHKQFHKNDADVGRKQIHTKDVVTDVHRKQFHKKDTDVHWVVPGFGILFWVGFFVVAVAYECYPQPGTDAAVSRDGRWDAVKFWCMVMVLWSHFMGIWHNYQWWGFPQELVSHFHMPGFSLVSGFFCAGAVTLQGNKASINSSRLKGSLRDLILVQVTVLPVVVLSPLTWASKPQWSKFASTPLIKLPNMWYLDALFLWQALTPLISTLPQPVLIAGIVSFLVRSSDASYDGVFFYFPIFVLGFVLGGGTKPSEERSSFRKHVEECLVDVKTRIAAGCLVTACLACWPLTMPEPLMNVFSFQRDFHRTVTTWSQGGWGTDAARMMFDIVVTLAFLVIIFMLPPCKLLSDAGSRTLYVYVLHTILIYNPALEGFMRAFSEKWHPFVTFIMSFTFTLLLGSALTKRLLHHFVQPQWLVNLCTTSNHGDIDKAAGGMAGKMLTGNPPEASKGGAR